VNFTGKAPEMKVPAKRKDAEFCKGKEVKYNAVIATGGKLQDTLVRIENGGVKGKFEAPKVAAHIDQVDCMYTPRLQGVVAGQDIAIKNSDGTLHNVHTYKGTESWFNQAQPKGAEAISKELEDSGVIKFTCDVHPWMRGFVVVTDHPFFATSAADGSFTIEKVPAGKYKLEAWHAFYGLKTVEVDVADGKTVEATFTYDGTEKAPSENPDELKDLF
jgi:plastocyanin